MAQAGDWPTYQHDNARSGVTEEQLPLPLQEAWVYRAAHAPRPAWPAPAPRDIWHELRELKPLVTYDRAFHTVCAGDMVFFGSSADDAVRALDAATGKERWVFYAEGPVRLAPTVSEGKVYVGADDGALYCLEAASGALLWKHSVNAQARQLPGNGRIISTLPVRSGVMVEGGRAYCFAGLFPDEGVYQCALRANDGSVIWEKRVGGVSPQGYLLASPTRLFVPTGRTAPAIFKKETGEYLTSFEGLGGTFALVVEDLVYNRADRQGNVGLADAATGERIATFDGVNLIVKEGMAYLQTQRELAAVDRIRHTALGRERSAVARQLKDLEAQLKRAPTEEQRTGLAQRRAEPRAAAQKLDAAMEACFTWRQPCDCPYGLVLAGETFFAGGDDRVAAFAQADGKPLWTGKVKGRAYGLSVADGRLFVSTDQGVIHCFGRGGGPSGPEEGGRLAGSPYPADALTPLFSEAAEAIVAHTGAKKGYGLVIGSTEGRLAWELAKRTDLHLVAVEEDERKVAASRKALARAGLYGSRVVVHHRATGALPYGPYLFNLVVSERALLSSEVGCPATEVYRVLRPCGGTACLGQPKGAAGERDRAKLQRWLEAGAAQGAKAVERDGFWIEMVRGAVPGSGEWTRLYANAAQTACSGDELRGPMAIHWFGEPGPRRIVDRHHRPTSSLVKDGRLFVPGDDVVYGVDAYNGALLWESEVPGFRRVGALKDSGNMLVAERTLYLVAQSQCWLVDVENGKRAAVFNAPQLEAGKTNDWGYLNEVDSRLVGTGQAAGASFRTLHLDMVNTLEGDFRPVTVSRYLFALDRQTGKELWTYRRGTIMNNAITIGDGRVYLVESRNQTAMSNNDGRLGIREFCAGETWLVALDSKDGRRLYECAVELPFEHIMFLNYAQNTLLLTGSYNQRERVYYGLFAFHGDTGGPKWRTDYLALNPGGIEPAETGGSHGEQWQHPVIIGDRIYSRPYEFALHTGKQGSKKILRGGGGCGGWTGSAGYLYGRGSNPRMYDVSLELTDGEPLTQVSRPGCWLNIIPAGGLVLIPESSSGCTCAYPMQMSVALVPQAVCNARDLNTGGQSSGTAF